jgi:hypothetical protein
VVHTLTQRLKRLETDSKEVAAACPKLDMIRFIDTEMRVASTWEMATDKWTDFESAARSCRIRADGVTAPDRTIPGDNVNQRRASRLIGMVPNGPESNIFPGPTRCFACPRGGLTGTPRLS